MGKFPNQGRLEFHEVDYGIVSEDYLLMIRQQTLLETARVYGYNEHTLVDSNLRQ